MPRIHTHYDNLKVTRNAPPEVIRAAYKTLCQKFHPDRNPGDEKAKKTFLLIRTAYETLSDPKKRKIHDEWIRATESFNGANDGIVNAAVMSEKATPYAARPASQVPKKRVWQLAFCVLVAGLVLIGFFIT